MDDKDNQFLKNNDGESTIEKNPYRIDEDDPTRLIRTEVRKSSLLGNERIRVVLPRQRAFRRIGNDRLEATEVTTFSRKGMGRVVSTVKRVLIGAPIASARAEHEWLTKFKGFAILSTNPISSIAYATEAILLVLIVAGSSNLWLILPISLAIVALLSIVTLSYRQVLPAYPKGGGSYTVVKDNLGTVAGLVVAASLLIDYALTVSVSIASAVQNLISLFNILAPQIVILDVALVILITIVNLRGVRESSLFFTLPIYLFVASALLLIVVGSIKSFFIQHHPFTGQFQLVPATEPLTIYLILKSFAVGCSAMTGIEFVPNTVPRFKKPATRNAIITLTCMAVALSILFLGITLLATSYHIEANKAGNPTVISQIASQIFTGALFFMYPVFQFAILFILITVAFISYSDFPRLASLLARDNCFPHQFAFRGDRMAFSTGILFLSVLSSLLLIGFKGDTASLVKLYAIGVFLALTLTQGGMIHHWWLLRREHKGWLRKLFLNSMGALITFIISLVIASMNFLEGAWIVVILIPLLVLMLMSISLHYQRVERERFSDIPVHPQDIRHHVIIPIAGLDSSSIPALAYARSISKHVTAVHVAIDMEDANKVREAWDRWQKHLAEEEETHLLIIESPYRSLLRPLLAYIDTVHELSPEDTLTVILPEFIVAHWWQQLLHNQTALRLKAALTFRPGIVFISIPQHLRDRPWQ